jgi:uncharacterized protein (DUF1684 family)
MFVFKAVFMLSVFLSELLISGMAFSQNQRDQSYAQSIETWRQARQRRLTSETGWLTIAGLHWLQEGENSIGTDPSNDIVLTVDSAPARVGLFTLEKNVATFQTEQGVEVFQKGKKVQTVRFEAGTASDPLTVGRLSMWVHKSGERFAIRLRDPEHALRKTFSGLGWFPIDVAYRVQARFEPYDNPKSVPMLNVLGDLEQFTSPGRVVFELRGETLHLEPVISEENDLFFVFRDGTSGKETYGAARFLHADMPQNGQDGQVLLDFNKAYNPPCVFNPFTTCPLPSKDNRLGLRIEAGELMYKKL